MGSHAQMLADRTDFSYAKRVGRPSAVIIHPREADLAEARSYSSRAKADHTPRQHQLRVGGCDCHKICVIFHLPSNFPRNM